MDAISVCRDSTRTTLQSASVAVAASRAGHIQQLVPAKNRSHLHNMTNAVAGDVHVLARLLLLLQGACCSQSSIAESMPKLPAVN
jgi:hypothetical protein